MMRLIIFVMIFVFGVITAQTQINRSFSASKNQNISLKFDYPQLIKISTWDKDEVQISGTVKINYDENNNAFQIKESKEGNAFFIEGNVSRIDNLPHRITVHKGNKKLTFKTKEDYQEYWKANNTTFNTMSNGVDIDIKLEIKVPKSLKTQIESKYGTVEVRNFNGEIAVNAIYGGIDATIPENKIGKISAETNYGQIYSDLDARFTGNDEDDFHTLLTATPGNGPQYTLESTYGNIYMRKQSKK